MPQNHIKPTQCITIKPSSKHHTTSHHVTPEPQEMHFECQVEAADALSRFAQGVGLLVQWQQELLISIHFLCHVTF